VVMVTAASGKMMVTSHGADYKKLDLFITFVVLRGKPVARTIGL